MTTEKQTAGAALINKTTREKEKHRKQIMWRLFVVSFISLFWEILFIRWLPCELPFLAFFRSLVLLACFLGLGLGCIGYARLKTNNGTLIILFLIGVLAATVTIMAGGEDLRSRGFGKHSGIFQQTKISQQQRQKPHQVDFTIEFMGTREKGEVVIFGVFAFTALIFFPLGVIIARYFSELKPLQAYLINISGALAGTLCFIVISFLSFPPVFWFFIGLIPCFFLIPRQLNRQATFWFLAPMITFTILLPHVRDMKSPVIWSPYQRVSVFFHYANLTGFPLGLDGRHLVEAPVFVNYDYHQCIMDYSHTHKADPRIVNIVHRELDKLFFRKIDTPSSFYRRYSIPYQFINNPKDVLIIGAGIGNEAAAAVRAGATNVDAVEIDPGIIEIGSRYHPERPYHQPGVNVICRDARAFLEQSEKQYDLIVKNAVDSHTQFASSANLRLDSYIMTIQFFEQIRRHLKPDGLFAMEFSGYHWSLDWAQMRIREILWRVFGYQANDEDILWGAGGPMLLIEKGSPPPAAQQDRTIRISTDDWPQFFLRKPMIPRTYLILIIGVLFISTAGLAISSPGSLKQVDAHFLLLGAAFMMLEIKSITELSLIIGATWLVNSVVIAGVLLAIAMANIVVLRFPKFPCWAGYLIIFLSLAMGFLFHPGMLLGFSFPVRTLIGILRVALPIFGAGLVFASSFHRSAQPPIALGWNLLGAMLGGLGEYLSLVTGVRLLGIFIILLYVLSLLSITAIAPQSNRAGNKS